MSNQQVKAQLVALQLIDGDLVTRMIAEAAYWYGKYDDSNPGVGMGPSVESLVDTVLRRMGLQGMVDVPAIVAKVRQMRGL